MATKGEITALYKRYLDNSISQSELEHFLSLVSGRDVESTISSLMDGTWQEMFEPTEAVIVPMCSRRWYKSVAAVIILMLLTVGTYFIFNKIPQKQITNSSIQQTKNNVPPGGNKAILTLANGKQIVLDRAANGILGQQGNAKVIKLDSGQLAYKSNGIEAREGSKGWVSEVSANAITTPRGGQYQIVLSDGTKVWLNSASSLKFPALFIGHARNVELSGEGYFEVAKNAGMPFRVTVGDVKVEVLGTHFNINAYNDEDGIKTTLLEGSVEIKNQKSKIKLKPGEQAILIGSEQLTINRAANVDEVVAWKEGLFHFESADLKTILRQMARWYDIEVIYKGQVSNEKYFTIMSRKNNLAEVLHSLQANGVTFTIHGRKLYIE